MANELKMPQLGLTMEEGNITRWLIREGDPVKVGDPVLELTTDKLSHELISEFEGVLLKIVAPEGSDVPVQGLLGYIGEAGETVSGGEAAAPAPETPAAPVKEAAPPPAAAGTKRVRISPLARKTAKKYGISYEGITGTGASGRIVQKDILAAAEAQKAAPAAVQPAVQAPAPRRSVRAST